MKIKSLGVLSAPYVLFFITISLFALIDLHLLIGTDNAYYFDIAYYLSRGKIFLVDFFDYRLPIFSQLIGLLYTMGLTEFPVRVLSTLCVYGLYACVLFAILNKITLHRKLSLIVVLISLSSILSWAFDASRNILHPLFHHALELSACYLLVLAFQNIFFHPKPMASYLMIGGAGFLSTWAFLGRQVQIFAYLLFFLLSIFTLFLAKKRSTIKKDLGIALLAFVLGAGVVIVVSYALYIYDFPASLSEFNKWLRQAPFAMYPSQGIRALKTYVILGAKALMLLTPAGIDRMFLRLPLFLLSGLSLLALLWHIRRLQNFNLQWHGEAFTKTMLLVCTIGIYFVGVLPTGPGFGAGSARLKAPLFTFYSLVLTYSIACLVPIFSSSKPRKIFASLALAMAFSVWIFYEYEFLEKNWIAEPENSYSLNLARGLNKYISEKDPVVLVLGGQQVALRLSHYEPFMGYFSDVNMNIDIKLTGQSKIKDIWQNVQNVQTVLILGDYPNENLEEGRLFQLELIKYVDANFETKEHFLLPSDPTYRGARIMRRKVLTQ